MNSVLSLLVLFSAVLSAQGFVYEDTWVIGNGWARPDCHERLVYSINGQTPGPEVRVPKGATVRVTVHNKLRQEEVSIHWHGIHQVGSVYMDGVPAITQCGILPGAKFTYEFNVGNQTGTFFYHSSTGLQRAAGLYGWFIVEDASPPFTYDAELPPLFIADWYHKTSVEQVAGAYSTPIRNTGNTNALLHNFKGYVNCSDPDSWANVHQNSINEYQDCYACNNSACDGIYVYNVEASKTYMLRIVNTGSTHQLNTTLRNHRMTIVEADGRYVLPYTVDQISTMPGSRFTVLITTNQPVANYYMNTRAVAPSNRDGYAFFHYAGAADPEPLRKIIPATVNLPQGPTAWFEPSKLHAHPSVSALTDYQTALLSTPTKRIQLDLKNNRDFDGLLEHWAINGVPYFPAATPTIFTSYFDLEYETPNQLNVFEVELGDVVEMVLQNHFPQNAPLCGRHPWHLHGHDFLFMGHGAGLYNATAHAAFLNTVDPPYKDTSVMFAFAPPGTAAANQAAQTPCGWQVFRWVATNPGTWYFSCNLDFHQMLGQGAVFDVAHGNIPPPPENFPICGADITWDMIRTLPAEDNCPAVNPCSGHGTCVDGVDSYSCICCDGYTGPTCAVPPADKDKEKSGGESGDKDKEKDKN